MKKILLPLIGLLLLISFQVQAKDHTVVNIIVEKQLGLFVWGRVFDLKIPTNEKEPFVVNFKEVDLKANVEIRFMNTEESSSQNISSSFSTQIKRKNEVLSSSTGLIEFLNIPSGESIKKLIEMRIKGRSFNYRITVENTGKTIDSSDL
jgi:hypothetical protein